MKGAARHGRFPHPGPLPEGEGDKERAARDSHGKTNPLQTLVRSAAEVLLVETQHGPAVVWVDPVWCDKRPEDTCDIAYARPRSAACAGRWVDHDPRYGPRCLVCQKPFVIERVDRDSSAWPDCEAWRLWRAGKAEQCGRLAAWCRVGEVYGHLIFERKL